MSPGSVPVVVCLSRTEAMSRSLVLAMTKVVGAGVLVSCVIILRFSYPWYLLLGLLFWYLLTWVAPMLAYIKGLTSRQPPMLIFWIVSLCVNFGLLAVVSIYLLLRSPLGSLTPLSLVPLVVLVVSLEVVSLLTLLSLPLSSLLHLVGQPSLSLLDRLVELVSRGLSWPRILLPRNSRHSGTQDITTRNSVHTFCDQFDDCEEDCAEEAKEAERVGETEAPPSYGEATGVLPTYEELAIEKLEAKKE